jgi:tetratricopeptide (TPR) repeat protein
VGGAGQGAGGARRSKRGEQDVALLIELATLIWKRLNQPDMAESVFRRVRKLDASNHEMVEFYREYYTAKNEPTQLLTILAQAQKTEGDVERRVAMGIEMARAAEKRPQHAEKAIEIWKGILRLKPHLPEAVTSLRALYTRTEKWNALLELLKDDLDAVPAADVDEKINRYLEIVAIYRDRLNLDVMVVNTYLNILALKPTTRPRWRRWRALRGAGALRRPGAGADPAGRRRQGLRPSASRCTGASPRCGPTSWASTATRSPASRRSSRPIRPTARPARASRTSTRRAARGGR